jgi:hypothetical protein
MLYRVIVTDFCSGCSSNWVAGYGLDLGEALQLADHIVRNVVLLVEGELRSDGRSATKKEIIEAFETNGASISVLGEDGAEIPFDALARAEDFIASLTVNERPGTSVHLH